MPTSWFSLLSAAFTGGLCVKCLDILYSEYKRKTVRSESLNDMFCHDLDLILKAADELSGKLCSLAKGDFKEVDKYVDNNSHSIEFLYIQYLFAHVWARVSILRRGSGFSRINQLPLGASLIQFVNTLEGRKNRVVPRAIQRVVGESLILKSADGLRCMSFYDFVECYNNGESSLRSLLAPLSQTLLSLKDKRNRQRVLLYGTILQAMIDTLDVNHEVSKDRPAYPNKLSPKTRRELKYRIFRLYLPDAEKHEKYWRVPEKNEPLAQISTQRTKGV